MIEKLIRQQEFNIVHLEFLLLKKSVPGVTGIAEDRCSTSSIKELSKLIAKGMSWDLTKALIKHGTIPDVAAIEASMQFKNPKKTLFIAEKVQGNVPCNRLLSLAISKKWHGSFVNYCINKGGKFSPKDIWHVLTWENNTILETVLNNGGNADEKDKGQTPLNFLLKSNSFEKVLILLKHNADTSTVDIRGLVDSMKDGVNDCSMKVLSEIICSKSKLMSIIDELNRALTIALKRKQYELAVLLIKSGADIAYACITDKSTTPVHVATTIALHVKGKTIL